MIFFREADIQFYLFAVFFADQAFFKTGDKAVGTDLEIIIGALAAFKSDSILKTLVIDIDCVAFCDRAVSDRNHTSDLLTLALDIFFNILFGHFGRRAIGGNAFVFS